MSLSEIKFYHKHMPAMHCPQIQSVPCVSPQHSYGFGKNVLPSALPSYVIFYFIDGSPWPIRYFTEMEGLEECLRDINAGISPVLLREKVY
jgi:hypothetical protein